MRIALVCTLASTALLACTSEPSDPSTGADPVPHTSGEFAGIYLVPTITDPSLAEAAKYPVEHVEWLVSGGIATLHYDLPPGLVGGDLDVTLSGPIAAGQTVVQLAGTVGAGVCTATGTFVSCREEFTGLGALPISNDVIVQRAALEYAGPADHRVRIASDFASDPIGVVEFDLALPLVED
jgi:hypothetical protein